MKAPISRSPDIVMKRILDAAEAEFMANGFEAASTNAITEAFGGSKATLFRHFPTKAKLLEAVIQRIAGRWRDNIVWDCDADLPLRERMVAFVGQALDWLLSEDVLFVGRLWVAEGRKIPDLRNLFAEIVSLPLERMLAEGLKASDARDEIRCERPEEDALLFLDLALAGVVSRALYGVETLDPARRRLQAERAADFFLAARLSDGVPPRDRA